MVFKFAVVDFVDFVVLTVVLFVVVVCVIFFTVFETGSEIIIVDSVVLTRFFKALNLAKMASKNPFSLSTVALSIVFR